MAVETLSIVSANKKKKCLVKWLFCNLVEKDVFYHEFIL